MVKDRKKFNNEEIIALETMRFKIREVVNNLKSHIAKGTNKPCDGRVGVVKSVVNRGATAYIDCNTCHEILQEDL